MDIAKIREDFPITREDLIYLNNAGVSPYPTPVAAAVNQFCQERSRTGGAVFWEGIQMAAEVRAQCARLINAETDEIALIENTATGINIVANMLDWAEGDNVVINDLEFFPYQWLRLRKHGVEVRIVRSEKPDGTRDVTVADLRAACDERTKVIYASAVSYINGLKHNLEAVGALAEECGAYLVVDGIQAVGALQIDVRKGPVDFLSCAGYKWLLSPLGIGFFYCRRELIERFEPAYIGWLSDKSAGSQASTQSTEEYNLPPTARRYMSGGFNMSGMYGLRAGIKYLLDVGLEDIEKRDMALADRFVEGIKGLGLGFLSPLRHDARSHIVTFVPTDVQKTLRALNAAHIPLPQRLTGIRVSPNFYNEEWEIDRLLEVVAEVERS
jgi:cysteine desulfurase/selenocysteine lyase